MQIIFKNKINGLIKTKPNFKYIIVFKSLHKKSSADYETVVT